MTELLVDYNQFKAPELAKQLHTLVDKNQELLEARYFLGVLASYGILAEQSVKSRQKHHQPGVSEFYAVVNTAGDVVGSASVLHNLPLSKLRLPIWPILARGPLSQSFEYASPNISAWTDEGEDGLLTAAFAKLAKVNHLPKINGERRPTAWVIEPNKSPEHIHEAIALAGLSAVATHRFDDAESRWNTPPISTLYTEETIYWPTSRGRLKELRTGKWRNMWQDLMDLSKEFETSQSEWIDKQSDQ